MKITNNCVQENTLTFQVGDTCYSLPELLKSCNDNTYVIALLKQILESQKGCCDPKVIRVPYQVVKYIELKTIQYVYFPRNRPLPPTVVIRSKPLDLIPGNGWAALENPSGWFFKYSNNRMYFTNNFDSTFYGVVKKVLSKEQFLKLFPDWKGINPQKGRTSNRKEIGTMAPEQWTAYYKSQKRVEIGPNMETTTKKKVLCKNIHRKNK